MYWLFRSWLDDLPEEIGVKEAVGSVIMAASRFSFLALLFALSSLSLLIGVYLLKTSGVEGMTFAEFDLIKLICGALFLVAAFISKFFIDKKA